MKPYNTYRKEILTHEIVFTIQRYFVTLGAK